MKRLILLTVLLTLTIWSFGQTNSYVTEYYLANTFTPKSGITPGSNNTLWMDCDQITARYNVTISGITTTGNRLPSQNQLSNAATAPTYIAGGRNYVIGCGSSGAITGSNAITVGTLFLSYSGTTSTSYTTYAIESINNNSDGDGNNFLTLKLNGTIVTGATNVAITGLATGANSGLTLEWNDTSGALRNDIATQKLSITYHIVDSNGLSGATQTDYIGLVGYYQAWVSLTNVATTHATITATVYGTNITDSGIYWGQISGTLPNKVSSGSTTSGAAIATNITGLWNSSLYYYKLYVVVDGGAIEYIDGTQRSFITQVQSDLYTTASSPSWVAQTGVTSITVEAWGGGGSGGPATGTSSRGGGGSGGSYSKKIVSVTPGNTYTVSIGAGAVANITTKVDGAATNFGSGLVIANGGIGGASTSGTAGTGATGVTTGSVGTTIYKGGNGGNGTASGSSGGGGSGAGSTGAGNNGSSGTAGAAKSDNGGAGGTGVTTANTYNNGGSYGGGGSGGLSNSSTDRKGGNGGDGYLRITYP